MEEPVAVHPHLQERFSSAAAFVSACAFFETKRGKWYSLLSSRFKVLPLWGRLPLDNRLRYCMNATDAIGTWWEAVCRNGTGRDSPGVKSTTFHSVLTPLVANHRALLYTNSHHGRFIPRWMLMNIIPAMSQWKSPRIRQRIWNRRWRSHAIYLVFPWIKR